MAADAPKRNHPGGRPPKYKPEFAEQAAKLAKLGATDVDLADFFRVAIRTIIRWQAEHEEFCHALKVGKGSANERVERSLYHKAIGYSYDAEKIFVNQGEVIRVCTREHVPPSDTAGIFWLKNRDPERWRDRQAVEHSGTIRHQHDLSKFSDADLDTLEAILDRNTEPGGDPGGEGTQEG